MVENTAHTTFIYTIYILNYMTIHEELTIQSSKLQMNTRKSGKEMCIRDRCNDRLKKISNHHSAFYWWMEVTWLVHSDMHFSCSRVPVSYTHLDVYKRQPLPGAGPAYNCFLYSIKFTVH